MSGTSPILLLHRAPAAGRSVALIRAPFAADKSAAARPPIVDFVCWISCGRARAGRKVKHETQVLRLQALFPKAKRAKLDYFARIGANEADMVRKLLQGGIDKGGGSLSSPTEMVVPDHVPLID